MRAQKPRALEFLEIDFFTVHLNQESALVVFLWRSVGSFSSSFYIPNVFKEQHLAFQLRVWQTTDK